MQNHSNQFWSTTSFEASSCPLPDPLCPDCAQCVPLGRPNDLDSTEVMWWLCTEPICDAATARGHGQWSLPESFTISAARKLFVKAKERWPKTIQNSDGLLSLCVSEEQHNQRPPPSWRCSRLCPHSSLREHRSGPLRPSPSVVFLSDR